MITFYKTLSPSSKHAARILGITALTFMLIDLASGHSTPSSSAAGELPRASLQEVMDAIVDPAADGLWDAVETTVTADGEHTRTPESDADWADVRRKLIVLRESASLLRIAGRPVSHEEFAAEADGALNSSQIAARIRRDRVVFDAFATALGVTAQRALKAVEARDTDAMVRIGGDLDGVCEACHLHFWYPNQVIPPVP
jgi:cytochrome c556